jgi:hypothetical protein
MTEYDNKNSVILFKVPEEKRKEDWHAEYEGTWTDDDGAEYWATCKIKEGNKGKSLLVKRGKPRQPRKCETKGPDQNKTSGRLSSGLDDDLIDF